MDFTHLECKIWQNVSYFLDKIIHKTVSVNTGSVPLNDREPTPTLGGPTVQPPTAPATFFEPTEIAGSMPQNTMVEKVWICSGYIHENYIIFRIDAVPAV